VKANLPAVREVAALFVSRRSIYKHLPGVDCYDRTRNAANFSGGKPVIAHPPCRCWSRMRHQVALCQGARAKEMDLGKWAVEIVTKCGGVLEQPAGSLLWEACQLPRCGDRSDPFCFTVYVEQSWFGFPTPKPTWLLVCGVPKHLVRVPSYKLMPKSLVSFSDLNSFERSRTMRPFAEWLCQLSRLTWWSMPSSRSGRHVGTGGFCPLPCQ
jgi:hypothetical protein